MKEKKKGEGEFKKWFVAQMGKRPSNKPLYDLVQEHVDAKIKFENMLREYEATRNWDLCWEIALLTWQVKKKELTRDE